MDFVSRGLISCLNAGDNSPGIGKVTIGFISGLLGTLAIYVTVIVIVSRLKCGVGNLLANLKINKLTISLTTRSSLGDVVSNFIVVFSGPFSINSFVRADSFSNAIRSVAVHSAEIHGLSSAVITIPGAGLTSSLVAGCTGLAGELIRFGVNLLCSASTSILGRYGGRVCRFLTKRRGIRSSSVHMEFYRFSNSSLGLRVEYCVTVASLRRCFTFIRRLGFTVGRVVRGGSASFTCPARDICVRSLGKRAG